MTDTKHAHMNVPVICVIHPQRPTPGQEAREIRVMIGGITIDSSIDRAGKPLSSNLSEAIHDLTGESARMLRLALASGEACAIELPEPSAEDHGAARASDDAELMNPGQLSLFAVMTRMGSCLPPDEAMIREIGHEGVCRIAWIAWRRNEHHHTASMTAWLRRYREGYLTRLDELVAGVAGNLSRRGGGS